MKPLIPRYHPNQKERIERLERALQRKEGAGDELVTLRTEDLRWLIKAAKRAKHPSKGRPRAIEHNSPAKEKREKEVYAPLRAEYQKMVKDKTPRKLATELCVKKAVQATGLSRETVRREARFGGNKRPGE